VIFALDTDIFTLLMQGHARVAARYAEIVAASEDELTIPAVVRMEVLGGRFETVKKAATGSDAFTVYERLERTEGALAPFRILPIMRSASDYFDRLLPNKKLKKIGRPDLLIACIVLAHDATLVTRNTKDFANVPNLKLENWAAWSDRVATRVVACSRLGYLNRVPFMMEGFPKCRRSYRTGSSFVCATRARS
jgi:tRNA(fMet)-specific endonuclease VapC